MIPKTAKGKSLSSVPGSNTSITITRAGKFITPFGIYNVIHNASPTFLTTMLPLIYQSHRPFGQDLDGQDLGKDRLYGRFYTGLQLLGTIRTNSGIRFWYTVGVGNGRSAEQFSEDNDTSKSLLGRFQLEYEQVNLGFSHIGIEAKRGSAVFRKRGNERPPQT